METASYFFDFPNTRRADIRDRCRSGIFDVTNARVLDTQFPIGTAADVARAAVLEAEVLANKIDRINVADTGISEFGIVAGAAQVNAADTGKYQFEPVERERGFAGDF